MYDKGRKDIIQKGIQMIHLSYEEQKSLILKYGYLPIESLA